MLYIREFQVFSNNMMNLSLRHGNAFKTIYQKSSSWDGELATHADVLPWVNQQYPWDYGCYCRRCISITHAFSYCLHQNLERRKRELEAYHHGIDQIVNRYRLVLMQCRNRLFYRWCQQTTSMDYVRMASGKNMSDSTKRKILGSKLS